MPVKLETAADVTVSLGQANIYQVSAFSVSLAVDNSRPPIIEIVYQVGLQPDATPEEPEPAVEWILPDQRFTVPSDFTNTQEFADLYAAIKPALYSILQSAGKIPGGSVS
ncbi:MAG: hypothetical protein AB1631_15780 [Acidobacteriota bacterium]